MIRAKTNVFSDAYPSGYRNSKLGDQLKKTGKAVICPMFESKELKTPRTVPSMKFDLVVLQDILGAQDDTRTKNNGPTVHPKRTYSRHVGRVEAQQVQCKNSRTGATTIRRRIV
jgi:hypothetical protein